MTQAKLHAHPPRSLLTVSRVLLGVSQNSRRSIIQHLAKQVAQDLNLHPAGVMDALSKQEGVTAAGIGGGVALIDQCLEFLDAPYLLVARLNNRVDFHGLDARPVDLVALLLSPASDHIGHIRAVGRLTRALHDTGFCANLRTASSPDAIQALFLSPDVRALAA